MGICAKGLWERSPAVVVAWRRRCARQCTQSVFEAPLRNGLLGQSSSVRANISSLVANFNDYFWPELCTKQSRRGLAIRLQ